MAKMKGRVPSRDFTAELSWPLKGLDRGHSFEHQPPLTCREAQNIRNYNPLDQRQRGGPREGLTKLFSGKVSGAAKVQCLASVVGTSAAVSGGIDTRSLTGVAVADGDIVCWTVGTHTSFQAVTNGTNALSSTQPAIFAAEHSGKLFFADGVTARYFTASTTTATAWTATTAGTLPAVTTELPRLICTWRGRIVLAGIRTDNRNWFMSAVNDPFDWDYAPATTVETQAVAGNNSDAGKVGDVITGLCPAGDDTLIFFGDHTVWRMTGDPMAGGRIDLISDTTGAAWGEAFCRDDQQNIYFLGNKGGVFKLPYGGNQLERISRGIEELATNVNGMLCRMVWDTVQQGFYVFRTSPAGLATINFFYDVRNSAWWPDVYANPLHNPCAVHVLDGDAADDRHLLFGGQDGYVRYPDPEAVDDDGTDLEAHVMLGPILTGDNQPLMVKELHATLDMDAFGRHGPVTWNFYVGLSAMEAVYQVADAPVPPPEGTQQFEYKTPDLTGSWTVGRNRTTFIHRTGTVAYVWLFSTPGSTFRFERVEAVLSPRGVKRSRRFV